MPILFIVDGGSWQEQNPSKCIPNCSPSFEQRVQSLDGETFPINFKVHKHMTIHEKWAPKKKRMCACASDIPKCDQFNIRKPQNPFAYIWALQYLCPFSPTHDLSYHLSVRSNVRELDVDTRRGIIMAIINPQFGTPSWSLTENVLVTETIRDLLLKVLLCPSPALLTQ